MKTNMRILHISKYYPPYRGGIEDICYSIVSSMKHDFEQQVICFNDTNEDIESEYDEITIHRIGKCAEIASQPISFRFYKKLKVQIEEFKPDIIHLHLPNPLLCLYVLLLIPKQTKLILHWHSDIVAQKVIYLFFKSIESKILKRSDKIIVTSPQYLEGSVPLRKYKDKAIIIPNIISTKKLDIEGKQNDIKHIKERYNKPIVFFMGRHVPYKGIKYLLEAEKFIKSDCVILIAGSGPITNELKSKNTSDRIIFIGKIKDEEIPVYMSASKIFAFPSITKNEAFGVVLAEAMYCKAVPVTFTIEGSGVNWVNLNGITGIEVKNRDIKAYGEAIDYLLNNPIVTEKYANNAHQRVIDMFTIATVKNLYTNMYKGIVNI